MSTKIERRREAFRALAENYYNDLSCEGRDTFRHPAKLIRRAIEKGCLESVVNTDPRMTSTEFGAAAMLVARKVMENAKVARSFLDVEIAGQRQPILVVAFDRAIDEGLASSLLAQTGKVAILCKPDDKIAPGMVSDLLLLALEPQQATVAEAVRQVRTSLLAEAVEGFDLLLETEDFDAAIAKIDKAESRGILSPDEAARQRWLINKQRSAKMTAQTAPGISTAQAQAATGAGSPGAAAAPGATSSAASGAGSASESVSERVVATVVTHHDEAELKHDLNIGAKKHGAVVTTRFGKKHVAKFHDDKSASQYHKAVTGLGYKASIWQNSSIEVALDLHKLVLGEGALDHVEESLRSTAALAHMMKVFGPLGGLATVKEADPIKSVVMLAKQLHESVKDYDVLVDELSIELDKFDIVDVARLTVCEDGDDLEALRAVVTEDVQARATLLQQISRYILLGEGKVPEPMRVSFEAFVSHIKQATEHPAP